MKKLLFLLLLSFITISCSSIDRKSISNDNEQLLIVTKMINKSVSNRYFILYTIDGDKIHSIEVNEITYYKIQSGDVLTINEMKYINLNND